VNPTITQSDLPLSRFHLRVARPVRDIERAKTMYCDGLGLEVIGNFSDHAGFDGVMLGKTGADYHFEFTYCRRHAVTPAPTPEDLVVFYLPKRDEWSALCTRMESAGFKRVDSFNPYWDQQGATFEDADGYRIVLQNSEWVNLVKDR
jgi:catechol 2,3-dioxygenase-like lactoylglutathione lyase family enzyme